MKFTQAIKMALTSIMSNRMRSFLTMLGIIIGISSVIILIGIGNGSKQAVTNAIQSMGTNLLTIDLTGSKATASPLTTSDLSSIKKLSSIENIAPEISGSATAKSGINSYTTSVEASTPGYGDIRDVNAALGRFIDQDDVDNRYNVVDLGVEVVQNVYPNLPVNKYNTLVGTDILLNGKQFEIIGILESEGTTALGSNDNRVIMPLSTGERFLKNSTPTTYYVEAKTANDVRDGIKCSQYIICLKSITMIPHSTGFSARVSCLRPALRLRQI